MRRALAIDPADAAHSRKAVRPALNRDRRLVIADGRDSSQDRHPVGLVLLASGVCPGSDQARRRSQGRRPDNGILANPVAAA